MKKKLKLRKWVKVVITLIILGTGILIYLGVRGIGKEVTTNDLALMLCTTGWAYLIFGQVLFLYQLWES